MQGTEIERLKAEGLAALRQRDAQTAFDKLKAAADGGSQDKDVHMGLAVVAHGLKRYEQALASAGLLVDRDPRDVGALLIKADALKGLGRLRKASSCYMAALNAAPPPERIGPHLAKELSRAQQECAETVKQYEAFLRDHIEQAGFSDPAGQSRVGQSLDLMFGRKQVYHQQPLKFYFPELPQIQFYDPAVFTWREEVEAATAAIKKEALAAWQSRDNIEPYVPKNAEEPHLRDVDLMGSENWSAFHLYKEGVPHPRNIGCCPETVKALGHVLQPEIPNQAPNAFFSELRPGAVIPPHNGLMNVRLICHLPLVVPGKCALRVGNLERAWEEGKLIIFDDSIEHDARNDSGETRIGLLFDIWRPELTEEERAFVTTLFQGIAVFDA